MKKIAICYVCGKRDLVVVVPKKYMCKVCNKMMRGSQS